MSRTYESNGPDVKIRGTALHISEKYLALSRDAQAAGDRVIAENYLQHAEHYSRIVAAAQSQSQQAREAEQSQPRDVVVPGSEAVLAEAGVSPDRSNETGGPKESAEPVAELADVAVSTPAPVTDVVASSDESAEAALAAVPMMQSVVDDSEVEKPAPRRRTTRPRAPRKPVAEAAMSEDGEASARPPRRAPRRRTPKAEPVVQAEE